MSGPMGCRGNCVLQAALGPYTTPANLNYLFQHGLHNETGSKGPLQIVA